MTQPAPARESGRFPSDKLFIETSAQILRLQGSAELQQDIRTVIDATRQISGQIGTSAQVIREFNHVVNGFFDAIQARIALLTDQETDRPITELWRKVRDEMPKYFPGGNSLLTDLGDFMVDLFKNRPLVRPRFLNSVVGTYKYQVLTGFKSLCGKSQVFDKSSCDVWKPPKGECASCITEPSPECRLKDICITSRENLLASATTLAAAGCDESRWYKENLASLQALEGKELQGFIGNHPGQLGDVIIFWEVPDGWTILSRDKAFPILKNKHRKEIEVFMVRIPRDASGNHCRLRLEGATADIEATLDNYNSKGARVHAPVLTVRERQEITIEAGDALSRRLGVVTKFHKPTSQEEEKRDKERPTFGLKFRASTAKD